MNIHVYDTYVEAKDGHTMHFDVFTAERDQNKAMSFAREWLASIGEGQAKVSGEECRFCHIQSASRDVEEAIKSKGYFIYRMEGCP